VPDLRILEDLVEFVDGPRGDRGRLEALDPLGRREQCARGPILPTLGDHEQGEASGSTNGTVT
jgi:hypothetical protein